VRGKVKLSYKDQRDYDLLPARIEELDAEIAKGEHALADPDLYSRDPAAFARMTALLDKLRTEKEAAEERWLALAEMAEAGSSRSSATSPILTRSGRNPPPGRAPA
jgi:ATP-binding cassette subfamily F protein uup